MLVVIDTSAHFALIPEESGADIVLDCVQGSLLSAVNLDEVLH